MCVVSMVMRHYEDWWQQYRPIPYVINVPPAPIGPTPQEVAEFRKLLRRAREYDKEHNEPDCELESKKQQLLDLAKELGVDISFINEPGSP